MTRGRLRMAGVGLGMILSLALFLGGGGCSGEPQKPEVGFQAPDFTLTAIDGSSYRLKDLRGKVVFVNIWATWCPPCRQEMPSMVRLYNMLKGEGLEILAVSEDRDPQAVRQFAKRYGVTFPILMDEGKRVYQLYRATGVPETHLVNREGKIEASTIGPFDWTDPRVVQKVRELLGP